MEKRKKNGKLLFQVGLVVSTIFMVVILTINFIMYQSTTTGYLEAQEDLMSKRLYGMCGESAELDDGDHWLYNQVALHPEIAVEELTEEERSVFSEAMNEPGASPWEPDWIMEQPEEIYRYSVKMLYQSTYSFLQATVEDEKIDSLFFLALKGKDQAVILHENRSDGKNLQAGTVLDIPLSDHPAIRKIVEEGSREILFERTEGFPSAGSYYIGYLPLYHDGQLSILVGIAYDWRGFRENMRDNLMFSLAIGVIGLVLTSVLLLVFLYRKAILPVASIQKSLRGYIADKDSEKIIGRMETITARNEIGSLSDDISLMAKEIDRYTGEVAKLSAEHERIATELNLAAEIQDGQLSKDFPEDPHYQLFASMDPAKEVGGDFYDFFLIDKDHLAIEIADVAGKGVPAALFMMMCKNMLKQYAIMGLSPAEVLRRSNNDICQNNQNDMFVTVWFGIYEISSGRLTEANAGHEYPVVCQGSEGFSLIRRKHGMALGVMEGLNYKEYEFSLNKGDLIFVYTDGVPEAADCANKLFGTDRMLEALNRVSDRSPQKLLQEVRSSVNRFVGDAPQFDDMTMLCLKVME